MPRPAIRRGATRRTRPPTVRLLLAACLLAQAIPARQPRPGFNPTDGAGYAATIKSISYRATLGRELPTYDFADFDVNRAEVSGRLRLGGREAAYSKWVTPKRTRSFPYERVYDTLARAPLVLAVIPAVKDEGRGGDLDRVQYSTLSLMSLLGVHVVLAYYDSARRSTRGRADARERLTDQRFDSGFVKEEIAEIARSGLAAPEWNARLFERRLVEITERAIRAYESISAREGVALHDYAGLRDYVRRVRGEYEEFRRLSLLVSRGAARREVATTHRFEVLGDGDKVPLVISDALGGLHYWTVDEAFGEGDRYVLQEAKNSTRDALPAAADVKDGLLKLILYSNFAELRVGGRTVRFVARLKLTGRVAGSLKLPAPREAVEEFLRANAGALGVAGRERVEGLQREAAANRNLEIVIRGNR